MMKPKKQAEKYTSKLLDDLIDGMPQEDYERTKYRMLLAKKIDTAIKAKGWQKGDLAKALKKRPSEITRWLSGTHNFTSDTLFDIQNVLEINLIDYKEQESIEIASYKTKAVSITPRVTIHTPPEAYILNDNQLIYHTSNSFIKNQRAET